MPARRPVIVQHSFGDPGSGGPIGALQRLLDSPLADRYEFVRLHQHHAAGGIDVALLRRWVSQLRDIGPDLVHVRGLGNEGFHGALAARLAGVPATLVSIHGSVRDLTAPLTTRRRVVGGTLEPASLRLATDIVTVCRAMSERRFLDPYRPKLRGVVPNGVEEAAPLAPAQRRLTRADLDLAPDRVVLVSVGRLSHEKGHEDLMEALRLLPDSTRDRVTLLLVGDGPDRTSIVAGYTSVPWLDLRVLGRRLDVMDLLHAGDLFVFPSLHENLSNALIEAMSVGLPVVATAVGGNVEVLERGGGVLVPSRSPVDLGSAIGELVAAPEIRARLGDEAREIVRDAYSVDRMVAGWDAVYERILDRRTR